MLRRLLVITVFLVVFGTFVTLAFTYENEKSNMYYVKSGEDYALVALDTDELYAYGFYLEDELTVTNGENYTSFSDVKEDTAEAISYLEYTFGIEDIRYLDPSNPDYGSTFANYLVNKTEGSYVEFQDSLTNLPKSYESSFNVQYLRLGELANYNSEMYMDKDILTAIVNGEEDNDVNTIGVPIDETMVRKVFINIESVELICEEDICTYDPDVIGPINKQITKLINDEVVYINQYSEIPAKNVN